MLSQQCRLFKFVRLRRNWSRVFAFADLGLQAIKVHVVNRRDIESHDLREEQAAHHRQPKPRRESAPAPKPIAMGRVPISAAMVVIMMGRKRTSAPS